MGRRIKNVVKVGSVFDGHDPVLPKSRQKLGKSTLSMVIHNHRKSQSYP